MKKILLLLALANFSSSLAQIPSWTWGKNISTNTMDKQNAIATDSQGNVYMVGDFKGSSAAIGTTMLINNNTHGWSGGY